MKRICLTDLISFSCTIKLHLLLYGVYRKSTNNLVSTDNIGNVSDILYMTGNGYINVLTQNIALADN